MVRQHRQRGFSLIGLLLAVSIMGIMLVMALDTYQPTLQSFEGGLGNRPSFRLNISRMQIRRLHQSEVIYFSLHRSYATWDQLVADGEIQRGYTNRAMGPGTPYMPYFDIDIQVTGTGFVITATPNVVAGALEGTPILRMDQSGNLEEVPAQ